MLPGDDLSWGPWYDERRAMLRASEEDDIDEGITGDFERTYMPAMTSGTIYEPPAITLIEDYFKFKTKAERQASYGPGGRDAGISYEDMMEHMLYTIKRLTLTLCILPLIFDPERPTSVGSRPEAVCDLSDFISNCYGAVLGVEEPGVSLFAAYGVAIYAIRDNSRDWIPFFSLTLKDYYMSYVMLINALDGLNQYGVNGIRDSKVSKFLMTLVSDSPAALGFPQEPIEEIFSEHEVPRLWLLINEEVVDMYNVFCATVGSMPGVNFILIEDVDTDEHGDDAGDEGEDEGEGEGEEAENGPQGNDSGDSTITIFPPPPSSQI